MGYRAEYFKHAQAVNGKYQCCNCGGWFKKEQINVDHRIPKKHGGTDSLTNLQAMCEHCNKSKGAKVTATDYLSTGLQSAANGELGNMFKGIAVQELKNALGIKYKRK